MVAWRWRLWGLGGALALAVGCGSSSNDAAGADAAASTSGPAGATTSGTAGVDGGAGEPGGAGGGVSALSGLPVPPGSATQPRPTGTAANLKVLPWAGFKAALTYTFDDAQPSQIDHWADLKATGVPATYYITTSSDWYAGFDATWNAVYAAGNELGNHTVDQCNFDLSGCAAPLPTPAAEIDDATTYITTKLGPSSIWTMAYPFGDTGYEPLAQARFFLARGGGVGAAMPGLVMASDDTDPFNLPCYAAVGGEAASAFDARIDAARTQGAWLIFLFHTLLPDAQNWSAGVDIASVTGSMTHAKSLPDVWIGTVRDVGAYWLGQKIVESITNDNPDTTASSTWGWSVPAHFPPGKYVRITVSGGSLAQGATKLVWDSHGYYEVSLDAGGLTWTP